MLFWLRVIIYAHRINAIKDQKAAAKVLPVMKNGWEPISAAQKYQRVAIKETILANT